MSTIDNGGLAFPAVGPFNPKFPASSFAYSGMSLRDWFAGQALAGLLAGGFADTIPHDDISGGGQAAGFAFMYADAMIAARKMGETP